MIISFGDAAPSALEVASWIAQLVIATTALVAAFFGGVQLLTMRRVSQASLLLELDARFDSAEFREARNQFATMRQNVKETVAKQNPMSNDGHKQDLISKQWAKTLSSLRTENEDTYLKLIGWLGFFETMGMMVSKKYLSEADVFDLFRGPLVDAYSSFHLHIAERQKETGVPNGLFEHALKLGKNAGA